MTLYEWVQNPENLNKYREWRDLPITQFLLDQVQLEIAARPLPSPVRAEDAIAAHSRTSGSWTALDRLKNIDAARGITTEMSTRYDMKRYLLAEGRNPADVDTMIEEYGEDA